MNLQFSRSCTQLASKEDERRLILQQLDQLGTEIESLKFGQIQEDLRSVGLPAGEQIWHSAMVLSFARPPSPQGNRKTPPPNRALRGWLRRSHRGGLLKTLSVF